jgi:broad specificity phosphatase PhoE
MVSTNSYRETPVEIFEELPPVWRWRRWRMAAMPEADQSNHKSRHMSMTSNRNRAELSTAMKPTIKTFPAVLGFISSRDARLDLRHRFMSHRHRSEIRCTDEDNNIFAYHGTNVSRRSLLHSAGTSLAGVVSAGPLAKLFGSQYVDVNTVSAMGLVQFPCEPGYLANTYNMMRAGESRLEAEGILSTNPLFLTNQDDSLSDLGKIQVEASCNEMLVLGINPSVVKYSLASKCIETANIVASKLMVGRNRIVPEFTFMDQRSVGLWDGKSLNSTEAAVWAMDTDEGGDEGRGGKPPPNEDGTPNETLFEQVTRLRQLMSILETQYSGDDILLIFPDGTSPALLSCLISGIPLKEVHALNFLPGELRAGVNMKNTRQLLKERVSSPEYLATLARGRDELKTLRRELDEYLLAKEGSKTLLIPGPESRGAVESQTNGRRSYARKTRFTPDILATGALLAIGSLAMLRVDKDGDENRRMSDFKPVPSTAELDPPQTTPFTTDTTETVAIQVSDSADGIINPNVFQDIPVLSKEDRVKAAELAMEEYLSQDDGGDAWLSSMLEIRDET